MLVIVIGSPVTSMASAPQPQKFTNRLAASNNPYLLLHADNPVDWYFLGAGGHFRRGLGDTHQLSRCHRVQAVIHR